MDTLNIEKYGFNHTGNIFRNNPPGALVEKALLHKEGRLSRAGALCIETGERTGRSPDDKYIVDTPAVHDLIAWGNVNRPVSSEVFDQVYDQMIQYLNDKDSFTVARVIDGLHCIELHTSNGISTIEKGIRTAVDYWESEIEEINWFNFDMTEEEIADRLWELFDYNFGEENGKEF